MPVAFGPAVTVDTSPPSDVQAKPEIAIRRNARFNGVLVTVTKFSYKPGARPSLEVALSRGHPSENLPNIVSLPASDVYEAAAIRRPFRTMGEQCQTTVEVIEPKVGSDCWIIIATGCGEAAQLADKTARQFVLR